MKKQIKNFMENVTSKFTGRIRKSKKGGSLVEFIVIIAVISGLCFVTLSSVGGSIKQNSTKAIGKMDSLVEVSESAD